MRFTASSVLALAYATAVLASPLRKLQVRQNGGDDDDDRPSNAGNSTRGNDISDDDSDDAVLFSPANLTTVAPGSTFNFTYLCDDDDCSSVRVALIQYIEIATGLPSTPGNGGRVVNAQLTVPANITAGQYVIGVQEFDDDDSDDDNDDDDRNENNPYDFDVNFESPDDRDGDERPFLINVEGATA